VYHFKWVARALWTILTSLFRILCTHFFDDFPTLEAPALADSAQSTVDGVFELLGWATKDHLEFSPTFAPLGVVFDLAGSSSGEIVVRNKAGRVEDLQAVAERASRDSRLIVAEARQLRGRFSYARGQTFGRCGAPALRALGRWAEGDRRAGAEGGSAGGPHIPVSPPRGLTASSSAIARRSARPHLY